MDIRDATPADAPAACQVIRRSITELCVADHHNDPEILRDWLANKTPTVVDAWITNPSATMKLVVEGDAILAVGSVSDSGEIQLNYVLPDARFRGVSRALMRALEDAAREKGVRICTLTSTETARRFYLAIGYVDDGPLGGRCETAGSCPMSKPLT
jgi:GNAT superfamily N-acetyltransferase